MALTNLLISNFNLEHGTRFVAGVRIVERRNYTPIDGGYDEAVIVEGNRERLREAVARGLDYAREHGITVVVNNPLVWEDIEMGIIDTAGLIVVDSIQGMIIDDRERRSKSTTTKNNPEALQKIVENLLADLLQNHDCSKMSCCDCPLHLRHPVEDSWGAVTQCGWLVLVTASLMILRK